MPVKSFVTPEAFEEWQRVAEGMGFKYVASGPLVLHPLSLYLYSPTFIDSIRKKTTKINNNKWHA